MVVHNNVGGGFFVFSGCGSMEWRNVKLVVLVSLPELALLLPHTRRDSLYQIVHIGGARCALPNSFLNAWEGAPL